MYWFELSIRQGNYQTCTHIFLRWGRVEDAFAPFSYFNFDYFLSVVSKLGLSSNQQVSTACNVTMCHNLLYQLLTKSKKRRAIVFDKSDLFGLPRLHDGGETSVVVAEELRTLALASTGLH